MRKRVIAGILALLICVLLTPAATLAGVGDGDWSNGWELWDQKQSSAPGVRRWGSLVVAQAKLLCCAGIVSDKTFHPDIYYSWLVNVKLISSDMQMKKPVDSPSRYADTHNMKLSCVKETDISDTKIWSNIKEGRYTILCREDPNQHYVFVNNEASLSAGKIKVYESWGVDDNDHEFGENPGTRDWESKTTEVWTYSMEIPAITSCSLEVNGWMDGKELDSIEGVGTFDAYIDGKKIGNNVSNYSNADLPAGTKYEFKDIKAANGYEYVGVRSGSLKGTLKENTKVVLEFRRKTAATFTFKLDESRLAVGETYAEIGCFKVYANVDIRLVKRVGCQLFSEDGQFLAGCERDAIVVGDHLEHSFRVSAKAGKEDVTYALVPNTQYKIRIYVIYEDEKVYGDMQSFRTTPASGTVSFEPPANAPSMPSGSSKTPKPTRTPKPTKTPKVTNTPKATRTPKITTTPKTPTITPYGDPTSAPQSYVTIVNVRNKLSVRQEATADSKRLGYAYNGEVYPLISVKGDWYRIQYKSDVVGYVKGEYVVAHNEYLVPHMENEYDWATPKSTKTSSSTAKPTPTREVYITEPPAYVTEPPPEVLVTELPMEHDVSELPVGPGVTENPEEATVTEPSTEELPSELPPTDPDNDFVISFEGILSSDDATNEADAGGSFPVVPQEADASRPTKRPSSGRRAQEDEGDDEDETDSRLVIALVGIGGVLVASMIGVVAVLIRRKRLSSRKLQYDADEYDE